MVNQQRAWLDEEPIVIAVREVSYDPLEDTAQSLKQPYSIWRRRRLLLAFLMLVLSIGCIFVGVQLISSALPTRTVYIVTENQSIINADGIAPFFSPEVQYWEEDILRWAEEYDLDPNLIATIMQIESCGDPMAGSPAGAQGLFQVMPFHFAQGEVMQDPDTNAKRGMLYLLEGLTYFEGNLPYAVAGYNGGHGTVARGYHMWADETRRYYYWAMGIYQDALTGQSTSDRLNEWLANGGSILCSQAAQTQRSLNTNS
ncbi:MAG: hypothetical protein CUN55_11790 [Phototrophicales bacterium]|nr:MAG: hypothetical protein CUN55_11790 [Phototrophicales bacterium]